MTLSAAPALAGPFGGNGIAKEFSFDFKVFNVADLLVVKRNALAIESTLVLDVDYSVTLNGDQDANPGGVVLHPLTGAKLATGERLTITTQLEVEQGTDLTNLGLFFPQVVENMVDRVVALVRQLQSENVRTVRLPLSLADSDPTLPTPIAGAALVWNETGTAIVNGVATESLVSLSAYMANVIQAADAAEARGDLGAAAATLDAEVVKLTGAQTVAGIKTFSSSPIVPNPTTNLQVCNKTYADTVSSTLVNAAVSPPTIAPTLLVAGAPVVLSGSSTEMAGIPSWAKRVTVLFENVALSGGDALVLELGTASSIESTGYLGGGCSVSSSVSATTYGLGFLILVGSSTYTLSGSIVIAFMGSNTWVANGSAAFSTGVSAGVFTAGRKSLAGVLTRVRLRTSGSNTFASGSATLLWE